MSDTAVVRRLTVVVDRTGNVPVVRCSGRLVAGVSDHLYREVSQLTPGSKRIVLDFTGLTHMDSMGLGTLVRLYVHAKSAGCVLDLMNVGKSVRQLLGIAHMMSVFQMIGENNIRMG
jgi:anti-sigma B factor antagonist